MNRADAYYEPTNYDDRSDEIEERTWQLMKPNAKFDPKDAGRVLEALGEISLADVESLQNAIDTNNFELIGRKIMSISFAYMESIAKEIAETEINEE